MKPHIRSRKKVQLSAYTRFRPCIELLEDRLPPGNMLSMDADPFNTQTSVDAQLGETTTSSSSTSTTSTQSISILQPSDTVSQPSTTTSTSGTTATSGGTSSTTTSTSSSTTTTSDSLDLLTSLSSPHLKELASLSGTGGSFGSGSTSSTGTTTTVQMGDLSGLESVGQTQQSTRSGGFSSVTHSDGDGHEHTYYDARRVEGAPPQSVALSPDQQTVLTNLQQQMPWLRVVMDNQQGVPATMFNAAGALTGPSTQNAKDVAVGFIQANKALFRQSDADIQTITVSHQYSLGSDFKNHSYVYLEQQPHGIPVYGGITTAAVNGNGQLFWVGNRLVPDLLNTINTTTPVLSPTDAVRQAAAFVEFPSSNPTIVSGPTGTEQDTFVVDTSSDKIIPVQLRYLPTGSGETRLVWNTTLHDPNSPNGLTINVDAVTGQVWTVNNLTRYDSYRVLRIPIDAPPNGSFTIVENPADPLANGVGSVPYPPGGAVTWHNIDGDPEPEVFDTRGNNAIVQEDVDGDDIGGLRPTGRAGNNYNYPVDFSKEPYTPPGPGTPGDVSNLLAAVVQAFYTTNVTHDVLYHYGFTEAAGNYQFFNFGRGGIGGDPLIVDVLDPDQAGPNIQLAPEGFAPTLTLTLNFGLTTPQRDAAFQQEIGIHEYGHGIVHRLIAGPFVVGITGGNGTQSGGMDEGWSDYYGIALTHRAGHNSTTNRTSGNWFLGQPGGAFGVRRLPYTTDKSVNPLTYNDIDDNQVDVLFPFNPPIDPRQAPPSEVHNAGEVWASMLWDMHWKLTNKYGFSPDFYNGTGGNNVALRLVTEGLRLTPAFPTMIQARDAILAADTALYGGANHLQIWQAFARRGLGQFAASAGGDTTAWVREDFTVPPIPGQPGGGGGGAYPGRGENDNQYEPNEFSNNAFDLGTLSGANQFGGLAIKRATPQDRDWFRFKVNTSGRTVVRMDMASGAGDLDVIVYRRDSSGTLREVGRGARRQDGGKETVAFNAQAGTQYFFQVVGYRGDRGNYGVTITAP